MRVCVSVYIIIYSLCFGCIYFFRVYVAISLKILAQPQTGSHRKNNFNIFLPFGVAIFGEFVFWCVFCSVNDLHFFGAFEYDGQSLFECKPPTPHGAAEKKHSARERLLAPCPALVFLHHAAFAPRSFVPQ